MSTRTEELLQHLDKSHAALLDAIESVPAELHRSRPGENGWSVAEVVEHLALVEYRLAALLSHKGVGTSEAGEAASAPISIERVADRSARRVASESSQPTGELDTEEALDALDRVREELRETVQRLDGGVPGQALMPHPAFGPLDFYNWIVFIAGHETRHAAQIREIGGTLTEG